MITLTLVKRTNEAYQNVRDRHYILNRGTHGQQLHYLIHDMGEFVGIISGASAVHSCAARDEFFSLSKDRGRKEVQINGIVNNIVFRIEKTRHNLASEVLAIWRRRISLDWEFVYGVRPGGFETFVIEEVRDGHTDRRGTLYKADNWVYVGNTAGNTKAHEARIGSGGLSTKHSRRTVEPKMIFCRLERRHHLPQKYESSWRNPALAKLRQSRRTSLFNMQGPVYKSVREHIQRLLNQQIRYREIKRIVENRYPGVSIDEIHYLCRVDLSTYGVVET